VLKDIIVSVSFAGIGLVLYLATINVVAAIKLRGHERKLQAAYVVARVGFALMVGLITEAVWRVEAIPWTWRSVVYAVGGVFVCVGYLGVLVESRKVKKGFVR